MVIEVFCWKILLIGKQGAISMDGIVGVDIGGWKVGGVRVDMDPIGYDG